MKKYRLKKDLPTFKAGEEFYISDYGSLVKIDKYVNGTPYGMICAYAKSTLMKYPNILTDWFEEIPDLPKTIYDLKEGDKYFFINSVGLVCNELWGNQFDDYRCRSAGNIFLTKKEAKREATRRLAKQVLLRDTKGFKPDWENTSALDNNWVYTVYYNHSTNILVTKGYAINQFPCDIWFATKAEAEAPIKVHEKEWKIYLGVED